jgi:O-antigen ligase
MTPPPRSPAGTRAGLVPRSASASPLIAWAVWLAPRVLAAYAAYLFAAYPVYSALISPAVALNAKLVWLALVVLAFARPAWSPFVLVALVPLAPWLTVYMRRMPQGLIHLIVLSQALPLLVRYVFGRGVTFGVTFGRSRSIPHQEPAPDWIAWAWAVFVTVAIASVCAHYGSYQAVFDSWRTFLVEVREHLAHYVFEGPNIELSNMIVAATALIDGLLVYLVVRAALPRGSEVSLLSAAAMAGIAAAVFGFYQWRTHVGLSSMWMENDPGIIRINATYTDPNALASYFALLIPIALGLAARETVSRSRVLWLAGVAAMCVALVMTAGRAGLLGACAGIAVWIALALLLRLDRDDPWPFVRRHFRKVVYGVAIAGALTLFALVAIGTTLDIRHHHQNTYLHTWLFTFNLRQPLDQIVKGRFSNWQTAALMVQDHPIFGIGIGRVFRLFANYNRLVGGAPEGARFSAHNTFLNVTAEMGIVGLLAFLTLLGVSFGVAIRTLRRAAGGTGAAGARGAAGEAGAAAVGNRGVIWVLAGLIAGLAAYTLTMIPGDRLILREDVVTFAALLAIVACLRDVIPAPAPIAGSPRARREIWMRRAALIVMAAILATVPLRAMLERRGIKLDRVTFGLHDVEGPDGQRFRWTSGHATYYRPSSDQQLTLQVRSVAPFQQTVSIKLNGAEIDRLTLTDHAWRPLRYQLPPRVRESAYYKVELEVGPMWRPPNDGRELGVMLAW